MLEKNEPGRWAKFDYYRDLWHVERAFRMSNSDLQARPILHRTEDAIRSHVLVCFMALMMGKYLEIKTGASIKRRPKRTNWQNSGVNIFGCLM